ncbi:MAG: hypothetical protein M5U18_04260 [Dehalococcoidia bacterium]|nr:hypothetical protein [Dehalococcoidia bacterium]
MTSSQPSRQRHTVVVRLTFAHEVSPEGVIEHLRETFNDDGSLLEAVSERPAARCKATA